MESSKPYQFFPPIYNPFYFILIFVTLRIETRTFTLNCISSDFPFVFEAGFC